MLLLVLRMALAGGRGRGRALGGAHALRGILTTAARRRILLLLGRRRSTLRCLLLLQNPAVRAPLLLLLAKHLVVQSLTVVRHRQLRVVVDGYADRALAFELVVRVVELHDVWVSQRFGRRQAPVGVELHGQPHEVKGLDAGGREHLVEGPGPAHGEGFEHRGREGRLDGLDVLRARASRDLHDAVQLVHGRGARKNRLARDQLPEDATHTPKVDAFGVRRGAQQNLWGAVPARGDVICQNWVRGVIDHLDDAARQAEVANLHLAVGVEEDVRGLDVAVQHCTAVHVLQGLEKLVDDVLFVNILEDVGADDSVQVGLHVVADQVDILVVVGLQHVGQSHDVLVAIELLQEHDLAEGALRIGGILEGIEALL
mmetsp:Transcript_603/g.2296  ORF Transcript_603/g.2296 Transcript_603/m.2296 type:complete len:371 (+) Transcript_603:176-1288(+)